MRDRRVLFNNLAFRIQPSGQLHLAPFTEEDEAALHAGELQRQLEQRDENILDRSACIQLPRGAQQPVQLLHPAGSRQACIAGKRKLGNRGKQAGDQVALRGRRARRFKIALKRRRFQRPHLQQIARLQDSPLNALAVEKRTVAAVPILDNIGLIFPDNDRMLTRDKWIEQDDVLTRRTANRCRGCFKRDEVVPFLVGITQRGEIHFAPNRLAARLQRFRNCCRGY